MVFSSSFTGSATHFRLAAYGFSLLLAFAVGFFLETCLCMLRFRFPEVTSFLNLVNTLNYFFSGSLLPLDLIPFW